MSDRLSNHLNGQKGPQRKIIGLVPAGGEAARLSPLPFSKELYPVGFQRLENGHSLHPKPVCTYLLEKMQMAGVAEVYIILREGKWDIPAYLGDGKMLDLHLAYLMMDLPFGVPYTLDQAYPFVQDAIVVFGFPDIIFQPDNAFVSLLAKQAESSADVVLGLYPAHQPHKTDMVDLDTDGRVRGIQIRPARTHLSYAWIIAVWTPAFTIFMHKYLSDIHGGEGQRENSGNLSGSRELFVGHVLQAAIDNQLRIEAVTFPDDTYLDIGTPDNLLKAVRDSALKIS